MNFFQAMSLGWVPVATVADLQDSPLPPADHPGPDLKLDPPAPLSSCQVVELKQTLLHVPLRNSHQMLPYHGNCRIKTSS